MTKWVILSLVIVLGILQMRLWGTEDSIRNVLRLKSNIQAKMLEVEQLKQRNQRLDAEVRALKNFPESLEERARSELGMIKPNETFFLIIDPNTEAR